MEWHELARFGTLARPLGTTAPTDDDGLTPLESLALAAILTSASIEAASHECNVPLRTLWRWLRAPHFAAALRRATRAIRDAATARAVQLCDKAYATLEKAMDADDLRVAVRAALGTLTNLTNIAALGDLEAEVIALKQAREAEAFARAEQLRAAREGAPDAADPERREEPDSGGTTGGPHPT